MKSEVAIPGRASTAPAHRRTTRALRLALAGIVCWGLLLGGAAAIVIIKRNEEAAARLPLPPVRGSLTSQEAYSWSHFPRFHNAIPVLAYHAVGPQHNYLTVTQRRFAEQMLALHLAGFHTVTIAQYAHYVKTGSTAGLPSEPILLTFDDGRLDAYRGANDILAKYHYTAVMFVVASWPDAHPEWALHWNELVRMQQSGIWQIQEHAGAGHTFLPINARGRTGEYYAYRRWQNGRLESFSAYKRRVSRDVQWGERVLRRKIPGFQQLAFAVPYSNYGQRFTNDSRIPAYFMRFMHTQFPVLVDGDYLDEGTGRPAEIKGRWSPKLTYRIVQGPVMTAPDLYCRMRDFVLRIPLWREYGCLKFDRSNLPSAHSD